MSNISLEQHQQQIYDSTGTYDENDTYSMTETITENTNSGISDYYQSPIESESHRTKLIKEVYTTEKSYNQHLSEAITYYLEPLKNSQPAILENHMLVSVFSNIEEIRELSNSILLDLEKILFEEQSESIFSPFLSRSKSFQLFIEYGKNQGNSIETFQKLLEKKPSFSSFIQSIKENQSSPKLDLNSLLITPVQRMPRYKLLFNELFKTTEQDHIDYKSIEKVLELFTKTTQCLNEEIRKQENKAKVEQIQSCLIGGPRLINDQRLFVREGYLMKVCRKAPKARWFFLFTDAVMYTSFNPNSLNNSSTNSFSPPVSAMHTTYTFHRLIMLSDINKIKDIKDREGQKNAFQIVSSTQKSFTVYSETVKEKDNWINDFKELLEGRKIETAQSATYEHTLGTEEVPVWVPDKEASKCMFCNDSFTIINRKHHCRNCGKIVCGSCSNGKKLIPNINKSKPVRVCLYCFDYISLNEKDISSSSLSHSQQLLHTSSSPNLTNNNSSVTVNHHGSDKYSTMSKLNSLFDQQQKRTRSNSNANLATFLPSSPESSLPNITNTLKESSGKDTIKKKLFGSKDKKENSLPIQPSSDSSNNHKDYNRTQSEPAFLVKQLPPTITSKGIPLPIAGAPIIQQQPSTLNQREISNSKFQSPEFPKSKLPINGNSNIVNNNNITTATNNGGTTVNGFKPPLPTSPLPPLPPTSTTSNNNFDPNIPRRTTRSNSQPVQPPMLKQLPISVASKSSIFKPPPTTQPSQTNNNSSDTSPPSTTPLPLPKLPPPKPPQRTPSSSTIVMNNTSNNVDQNNSTTATHPQHPHQPLPPTPSQKQNLQRQPPPPPPQPQNNNVQNIEKTQGEVINHIDQTTTKSPTVTNNVPLPVKRPLPLPNTTAKPGGTIRRGPLPNPPISPQ